MVFMSIGSPSVSDGLCLGKFLITMIFLKLFYSNWYVRHTTQETENNQLYCNLRNLSLIKIHHLQVFGSQLQKCF